MFKVIIARRAQSEVEDAIDYYDDIDPDLSRKFVKDLHYYSPYSRQSVVSSALQRCKSSQSKEVPI